MPRSMTRTRKILLSTSVLSVALLVLLCVLLTRPTVRANRLCRDAGFGRLPASAQDLHIERRGPPFTTQRSYLRFQVTAEDAASFFERTGIDPNDPNEEPGSMQIVRFTDKSPTWMQWGDPINGRIYLVNRRASHVWLAIDDDSHTIYVAVYESRSVWLRWLLERCGLG
jgi:hypothetical protein